MDSLSALGLFVRAAEAGSFSEAGRQVGLSSSAIGRAVARLEDRLAVRLFHRSTRSICLTQEGQSLLESCQRIFSEIRTIEQEFATSTQRPRGRLRLSLPPVWMLMLPAISQFARDYPEIELDMDFNDHVPDVIGGGYDVIVQCGEIGDSRLMSRKLGTYRMMVVGSPRYFAQAGTPTSPEEMEDHACLHLRCPANGRRQPWPLASGADDRAIDLPVTATVSTLEPLIAMAELGSGIACLPDFAIRRQIEGGSLVAILRDRVRGTEEFRAVWPSSRHLPPKVRAFLDHVGRHIAAGQFGPPPNGVPAANRDGRPLQERSLPDLMVA